MIVPVTGGFGTARVLLAGPWCAFGGTLVGRCAGVARLLRLEREAGAMGEMGGALVTQTR